MNFLSRKFFFCLLFIDFLFSIRGGLYRQVHLHFGNVGVDGLLRNMKMDASVLHQMKMRLLGELCLQSQQKIIAFETDL
jgi:hypothetical protein